MHKRTIASVDYNKMKTKKKKNIVCGLNDSRSDLVSPQLFVGKETNQKEGVSPQ